jgi:tRNA-specific 2-thiouridylase
VVRLDADHNTVIVGPRSALQTNSLVLRDVNWLGNKPLADIAPDGLPVYVRNRSAQTPRPAMLFCDEDTTVRVVLCDGEEGVATGQACVFYDDGGQAARVLGGGWIAKALKSGPTVPGDGAVRSQRGGIERQSSS